MTVQPASSVTLIPTDHIDVLNSRDRDSAVFSEIVGNIKSVGIKKPITVTERQAADGSVRYLLVCGEGRLRALQELGESHVPALVIKTSDEDAFIMSLAENIARRQYRPLEILADIDTLRSHGYGHDAIAQKTGLSANYVTDILFLLDCGEERLIEGVQRGQLPLSIAVRIARASDKDQALGSVLQEAYESGELRGRQFAEAERLVARRREFGPSVRKPAGSKPGSISRSSLVRTYQREVNRQKSMVLNADYAKKRLLFAIEALRKLFDNENFVNLLRAEQLDTLPQYLDERITQLGGV